MLVVIVNYAYSPLFTNPQDLLDEYFGLTGWVNGLTAAGATTIVFQRFLTNSRITLDGTDYHFVLDKFGPMLRGYQIPYKFNYLIANFIEEFNQYQKEIIIHVNGLVFPVQIFHLRKSLSNHIPIIIQHHAGRPRKGVSGLFQRICLAYANGFIFSTEDHARVWASAGVVNKEHIIGEIMETSSILNYEDRITARKRTGLKGNPILLWTGNLNHNKDPLTILKGFELIIQEVPDARLYMAYRYDDLFIKVNDMINSSEKLVKNVVLLGPIPYEEIASYYNSADYFVQGSHHEGSGIALLDAIACGVIPVVTEIPSFRVITGNGRIGALWNVGDPYAFAEALFSLLHYPIERLSLDARIQFTNNFSFIKLGEMAINFYHEVINRMG